MVIFARRLDSSSQVEILLHCSILQYTLLPQGLPALSLEAKASRTLFHVNRVKLYKLCRPQFLPLMVNNSHALCLTLCHHFSRYCKMPELMDPRLRRQVIEYLSKKGYNRTEAMLRNESATQDAEGRPLASRVEDNGGSKYGKGLGLYG